MIEISWQHIKILVILAELGGSAKVREIAPHTTWSREHVSILVRKLGEAGLVWMNLPNPNKPAQRQDVTWHSNNERIINTLVPVLASTLMGDWVLTTTETEISIRRRDPET